MDHGEIEDRRRSEIRGSLNTLKIMGDFIRERLADAETVGASGEIAAYDTVLEKIKHLRDELQGA